MRIAYFGDQRVDIREYDSFLTMCKETGVEPLLTCGEGHQVIARRGEKNVHHFAHKSHTLCSCSDGMTDWHIQWQDRVHKEYQEIRMEQMISSTKVLHIADICIPADKLDVPSNSPNGYVVEIQHSNMDTKTIQERERFYTAQGYTLVWVFDCSKDWEYKVVRRIRSPSSTYEEMTIRRVRGRDFHLAAQYNGKVLKFLDFNKDSILMVTKQSGGLITGLVVPIEEFDRIYLGSCVRDDRDMRPFNHRL